MGDGEFEIQGRKVRMSFAVECHCCKTMICGTTNGLADPPPADDEEAWAELAEQHAEGCAWIRTRAHRID
jgi:hypothetical protein